MRFFTKAPFYFVLLFFFALSCAKEDDEDCGCDGSTFRTLENIPARYAGNGTFSVPDTMVGIIAVYACDVDTAWEISKDSTNTWNYTISGDLKKVCLGTHPELGLPSGADIHITAIKKN